MINKYIYKIFLEQLVVDQWNTLIFLWHFYIIFMILGFITH